MRHKNTECFSRRIPPAVFWFLLHRCKRNSPAGEIPTSLLQPVKAGGWDIRPYGEPISRIGTYSYRILIFAVMSLMISAFSGSVFTSSSTRSRE